MKDIMKNLKTIHQINYNGFTLIELIAVVAIMGIITFLAVNNYTKRSEDAKKSAAMSEMQSLANAEKNVEAYYGYFLPLTVLDDQPSVPGGVTNADIIIDHAGFLIVNADTSGSNPPLGSVRTIRDMLAGRPTTSADTVRTDRWKGPFMQFQKKSQTGVIGADWPLDPWNGPYHFLSINGDEVDSQGQVGGTGFSNQTVGSYAIVSWGRDSTPGTSDDLYYKFQ
jgi:prepilin-type N-terminal cleavage/methylation domain-containing protein